MLYLRAYFGFDRSVSALSKFLPSVSISFSANKSAKTQKVIRQNIYKYQPRKFIFVG